MIQIFAVLRKTGEHLKVPCKTVPKNIYDDYNFNSSNILSFVPHRSLTWNRFCASWSHFLLLIFHRTLQRSVTLGNIRIKSSNLEIQYLCQTQEIIPFLSSCTREQYENGHLFCFVILLSRLPTGYLNSWFSLLPSL